MIKKSIRRIQDKKDRRVRMEIKIFNSRKQTFKYLSDYKEEKKAR